MARTGLGVPCPNCGKELSIEAGIAAHSLREAMRLRATEAESDVNCNNCGATVALSPAGAFVRPEPAPRPAFRTIQLPAKGSPRRATED